MCATTSSWSPPIMRTVPSSCFICSASAALPLRNRPAISRSRFVSASSRPICRTVVTSSGIASGDSDRRMISMVSPASIDCTCSRSPSPLMVKPCFA